MPGRVLKKIFFEEIVVTFRTRCFFWLQFLYIERLNIIGDKIEA